MAVFCIEKTLYYTVIPNYNLRNAGLSLKSKDLLRRRNGTTQPEGSGGNFMGHSHTQQKTPQNSTYAVNDIVAIPGIVWGSAYKLIN